MTNEARRQADEAKHAKELLDELVKKQEVEVSKLGNQRAMDTDLILNLQQKLRQAEERLKHEAEYSKQMQLRESGQVSQVERVLKDQISVMEQEIEAIRDDHQIQLHNVREQADILQKHMQHELNELTIRERNIMQDVS